MIELIPLAEEHLSPIVEIMRREGEHHSFPWIFTRDELEEMYDEPHFDPAQDGRVALVDGQVAGWGRVWHQPSGKRQERGFLIGSVDPPFYGRGVGSAILRWQIQRATEKVRMPVGDHPRYLRAQNYEWVKAALDLYSRQGLEPVRWFDEMLRPLAAPIEVVVPEGVTIRPWQPEDSPKARVVKNSAFEDHWGSTPTDEASWSKWLTEHGVRLDLSWVAEADGRLVGHSLNEHYPDDEKRTGRREGWIANLAVLREWRGRGVASALITASLERFAGEGFTHAALGVDSDNPTGAAGLYRRLGFESRYRSVTYQLEV